MATAQLGAVRRVFDHVRTQAAPEHGDGELLRRWHRDRDESAFAGLVTRHGGLVLGVCRRVLRDAHAAEDAFQATFLVLAKKADSVRPPGMLGPWLHGVAYRTALKARGRTYRRQQVEREYAVNRLHPDPYGPGLAEDVDLAPLIDEQLNALPEKYRRPLLLCGVQGLGKAEAAQQLGLPEGTVSSRLARGREMLRERLVRRGVIVPAAALAALLVPASLLAATQPSLVAAASQVAVGLAPISHTVLTLSREVLRTMTLAKFKLLTAVAVAFALSGGGFGLYSATADDKKPQPAPESVKKPDQPKPESVKKPDQPKPEKKPDGPKPEKKPDGPKLSKGTGKITNVVPGDRTIAMIRKIDGGGVNELYIAVADDAKITVDNKPAQLKDVPKESVGSYLLKPGAKDGELSKIVELHVTGGSVGGVVVKVSADSITVDPSGKEGQQPERTIAVGAGVKIVGGKDGGAKLADLKPGDKVAVTLTADGKTALQINAAAAKREGDKPGVKPEKPGVKPEGEKPVKPAVKPEKPGRDDE